MNKKFQSINIEDVLFFDAEIVRTNRELEVGGEEFLLFQKKTRNRATDELLSDEDVVEEYEKRAALTRTYNTIVSIGVGFVRDGVVYIKDISGDEESIIREFVNIMNQFKYNCSFNGIAFDLPMIIGNGMKYFNIAQELKDPFNTSGKKIWNMDMCIDLLEVFKGSHYYPNSLDEVCRHFSIPTPKDDITGAEVSKVYYEEGLKRISQYVKKDVLANVNIFRKMQFKPIFMDFIDKSDSNIKIESTDNMLQQLIDQDSFTADFKAWLEETTKDMEDSELHNVKELVTAHYLKPKVKKAIQEARIAEVNQLFHELKEKRKK